MTENETKIVIGLDESISGLNSLVQEAMENPDLTSVEGQNQLLGKYCSFIEKIIKAPKKDEWDALTKVCEVVRQNISAIVNGVETLDEMQFINLFQLPIMLEDFFISGDGELADFDELLDECGWAPSDDIADDYIVAPASLLPIDDKTYLHEDLSEGDKAFFLEDDSEIFSGEPEGISQSEEDGFMVSFEATEVDDALSGNGEYLEAEDDTEALMYEESEPQSLDKMQQQIVDLLRAELTEITEIRDENISNLIDPEAALRVASLSLQAANVERISLASEGVGLEGLGMVASQIAENLHEMDVSGQPLPERQHPLILEWPIYVLRYLEESFSNKSADLLVQLLMRSYWPFPLSKEESEGIKSLLCDPQIQMEADDVKPRQTVATEAELSLEIPADVNLELLESLLDELPDQTAAFSAAVQSMIKNQFVSDIELARRSAHTIKGACNTVGIIGLANMTHQLEDILDEMALANVVPIGKLADVFLDAADCMESMVEAVQGLAEYPPEALQVQQAILDWANHIDNNGIEDVSEPAVEPEFSGTVVIEQNATADITEETPESPSDAVLRIRSSLVDEMLRLAGENIISTSQVRSHLSEAQDSATKLNDQNQYVVGLMHELEQLVDVRGVASKQKRSSENEMDDLELEKYNELHTSTHRLIEATIDGLALTQAVLKNLKSLEGVTDEQGKLVRENQKAVLKTRMVPVSTAVPRLQRCVRQAVRATETDVRLEIKGENTQIDSNVLDDLMEPLMHLLRNAVAHGIESAEDRERAGKEIEGCIVLLFAREGDHISVQIQDDGRGLNRSRILSTAEEKGLLAQGYVPTDDEINNLILIPGFSTRTEVTQMSGRGVGMDVVNEKVRDMKGTLAISSQEGRGIRIQISLPVTLLSTHAMLLPVNGQLFAVSNFGVEEIIYANEGDIHYLGKKLVFKIGGDVVAAHFLSEKLGVAEVGEATNVGLLVRRTDGTRNVILVERVIDSRDLVVKPLQRHIPSVDGIVGATILGDGGVAPVLDLTELLASHSARKIVARDVNETAKDKSWLPKAIVVDDSYSARRSLEQFVSDLGFEVRAAKDGMDAVEMIADDMPDILLTDLEMPRMNGLDLVAHVRANERTKDMPVILITSRSTQKHRDLAENAGVNEYMTKPYSEDELTQHIETLMAS